MNPEKVTFQLKRAGYCTAHAGVALRGRSMREIPFPATYALIEHPREGYLLFDTGYTRRFYAETARWPGSLYARMTPVYIEGEEEAVAELARMGIAAEEVRYLLISHFHADHVGGLRDFPRARVVCTRAAYEDTVRRKGFQAVRRGLLPGLLPGDLAQRVRWIEDADLTRGKDPHLGAWVDLFGDGSIRLVHLPGHACGQMGALLNTPQGEVFLVADAAWLRENYQQRQLPLPVVRLFFDSWRDYCHSLDRIRAYAQHHPATAIIPTHCEATRQTWMS